MNGIMLALLAGSALVGSPRAFTDVVVRESWTGSRELPTAIAYYEFTRLLAEARSNPDGYASLLADALGVSNIDALGPAALRELRSYGEVFVAHNTSMHLEILESRIRILCSNGATLRPSRSAAYIAMNEADDISRPIQQKYLALAVAGLPQDRKHAFRSFLDEFKLSINYVKTDNRPVSDVLSAKPAPGAALERACADMQTEYTRVLQQGGQ